MAKIIIDADKCKKCKQCIKVCSEMNITSGKDGKATYISEDNCISCFHCVSVCPEKAITYDAAELNKKPDDLEEFDNSCQISFDDTMRLIRMRRTTRNYKKDPPKDEEISTLIEAAAEAPTAGNRNPLRYIVVKDNINKLTKMAVHSLETQALADPKGKFAAKWERIYDMYETYSVDRLFYHAPAVIVIVGNRSITEKVEFDAGIAAENISFAADSMGIGTCMNLFFNAAAANSSEIKTFLNLHDSEEVLLGIAIGYKDIEYKREVPKVKQKIAFI